MHHALQGATLGIEFRPRECKRSRAEHKTTVSMWCHTFTCSKRKTQAVLLSRAKTGKFPRCVPQEAVVKAARGEGCDAGVHAVLRVQHHLGVPPALQTLEQALPVVSALSLPGEDGGRKLCGVPYHDNRPIVVMS